MHRTSDPDSLPAAQRMAERVFGALERFLHIEAVSGVVLLAAAAIALIWANSPAADSYHHLWHLTASISIGGLSYSQTLHFLINDGLMTVFFLVVGMEIRREMHEGALSDLRVAALPLAAALGGVVVPALIYLALNGGGVAGRGWAVPTATDIAFAVGVLALLGKSVPGAVRIFLLSLAIIDDVVAVIIIALFYSGGLDVTGLLIAGVGVLLVLGLQQIGVGSALPYVLPGAVLWYGLLKTGAHPTLAGVVLGLMTPVVPVRMREKPLELASRALGEFGSHAEAPKPDIQKLIGPARLLRQAQRELLPPVVRVGAALHPWVAYGIMPLFALANAGVSLGGLDLSADGSSRVVLGVLLALVIGKPVGIVLGSWIAVRFRWCLLGGGVTWPMVWLVGCLGGIGFTMSIFIATLAFEQENLLAASKTGVLLASATAGVLGVVYGSIVTRSSRAQRAE
jgi:NhaA family Na+:H+ antiporter